MIEEDTRVLPTTDSGFQPLRFAVQVVDGDGEVVVRVHQPAVRRDDAVPVGVGVVARGDVERCGPVRANGHPLDQRGHGRRRRAVHPDLLVPVQRHEGPLRVHGGVHHGEVQVVAFADLAPVVHGGAAHGVGADADAGVADGVQVQHGREVVHVAAEEVELAGGVRGQGVGQRDALDAAQAVLEQFVGAVGDPAGGVGVGGAAVRRVVLEAAVAGRVVAGGDHDAVGLRCAGARRSGCR